VGKNTVKLVSLMPFDAGILVKEAIERYKENISVSCSFGKDSLTVLHMALKYDPNIKVVFFNTGVEFAETLRFKDRMKKEWNLNLYETKPIKSFWQCVKEYGLPTVRKKGGKGSNAPKCCYYLKEKPARLIEKKLGIKATITGLQACESNSRRLLAMRYDNKKARYMSYNAIEFCSQRWYTRSTGMWYYHPIMLWSVDDVWTYIRKNNLPINPVYEKWGGVYKRVGCLPCTAYLMWEERLSKSHPKLYRMLKKIQDPHQERLKP